jgi:hypothetical protein
MVNQQRKKQQVPKMNRLSLSIYWLETNPRFCFFLSHQVASAECNFYFLVLFAPVAFGPTVYDRWARPCLHHLVATFLLWRSMPLLLWLAPSGHVCWERSASIVQLLSSESSPPGARMESVHYLPLLFLARSLSLNVQCSMTDKSARDIHLRCWKRTHFYNFSTPLFIAISLKKIFPDYV